MSTDLAERLVAALRCAVVAIDADGRVTACNEQAAAVLSVEPSSALGRDCREVLMHCSSLARLLLDGLDRDTLPDRAELEIDLDAARRTLIGYSLSRLFGDAGEVLGVAIFFKDLTRVEEAREREALRNRLASLGEMAAQLAHEVRNRLGGIRLFVGLARRRTADDAQCLEYLNRADKELLAANEKMSEVLDFVRPLQLAPASSDLLALCREALEATLGRLPETELDVRWEAPPDTPPVQVDPARVRDALANLFANAVEAGATRLEVRVRPEGFRAASRDRSGPSGPRLCVEIADDGAGMPPEVLRRIFHPFFTTKEEGTGLGVSAAQKILDAHGGSLDVRSEPGRGSTFFVTLPCGPAEGTDG